MTTAKERVGQKVPKFKDEAEMGEFWDTNSPEDFPEHFQEVEASFASPLIKRGLTVKLDQSTLERLTRAAKEKGIGPSTLARMWILEHLNKPERSATP
ncbi:MAG: hypothetical protein EXR50_02535 [Dehalococcoidia bacterium]|nr:hypothetical protein [Dehalococcoidia bacterium]